MSKKKQQYIVSPRWRITQRGRELRLYGGGDAEYEVELPNEEDSIYANSKVPFLRDHLTDSDESVFEQMFTAGVIAVVGEKHKNLKVVVVGDKLPIDIRWPDQINQVNAVDDADVALVIRYTSSHEVMARKYFDLEVPYLYVDIAYHHTISLGPLVFAGETACLGCLYGRIASRWGDAQPPHKPRVAQYAEAISTLVVTELQKIAMGDTSLAGQLVVWDIDGRSMTTSRLLKSSVCPQCGYASANSPIVI